MNIAYTLVNIAYLPFAKTLADSFIKYNPDVLFYICLFDDKANVKDSEFLSYNIYDKNNLDKDEYDDMRNRYSDMSMACALKPFFAEALIKDYSPENIIYLDADLQFFSSLENTLNLLSNDQISIILTGHQYTICSSDKELLNYQNIRKYGIYNAGFFAIKNNIITKQFLNWWKKILFSKCIRDDNAGVYYDQTWLDLVPMYFGDQCHILKDLGYNVAYWNLEERTLAKKDNKYYINSEIPLVFYHFARFNYYNNDFVDGFSISFSEYPEIEKMYIRYKNLLKNNLFEKYNRPQLKKKSSIKDKIKVSLKYRISLLIDKL